MPFHICHEEILAFLALIPGAKYLWHLVVHKFKGEKPCRKEQSSTCSLEVCDNSDKNSYVYDPLDQ